MDRADLIENRTFDEIALGESASLERTVTKQDIELYATVSGDANPTHLDEAFAQAGEVQGDGRPQHALGGADLQRARQPAARRRHRLPGPGAAVCSTGPCGDTITVTVTAKEKRAEGRIVRFDCSCINQDGQTVLDGVATVIAPAEKLSAPAITLATASVQRHDSYRPAAGPCRQDPADSVRGGAPVRRELAARRRRGCRGQADGPDPGRAGRQDPWPWPSSSASTSGSSSSWTCRTAMPPRPRRSSWSAPARPSC